MRKFLSFLTILICVIAYSGVLNAAPTKPDIGPVENARTHYNAWRDETIPQAEKNVEKAFNAAMDLVNDYKNATFTSLRIQNYSLHLHLFLAHASSIHLCLQVRFL